MVMEELKNLQQTVVVFLNLSKAFDCVYNKTLLYKFTRGPWNPSPMAEILCDLSQIVNILNKLLDSTKLSYGVPQGFTIIPALFTFMLMTSGHHYIMGNSCDMLLVMIQHSASVVGESPFRYQISLNI